MGKLVDIENIDYVRLEDSLHCLEHHKGDEVECVICAPTVEAIPKADYEASLKADLMAILVELQSEIKEQLHDNPKEYGQTMYNNGLFNSYVLIQQKINELEGGNNEQKQKA
jgi:predicted hydrocarbon binding protein